MLGCDKAKTELKDSINRVWPPVSTFDRRAHALAASTKASPSKLSVYVVRIPKDGEALLSHARLPSQRLGVPSDLAKSQMLYRKGCSKALALDAYRTLHRDSVLV